VTEASFDLEAGDVVASAYRIEGPIGLGGSASVYRATPLDGREAVALKVMHETDPSGVGRQRFEREAALMQKLQHPNVVPVKDFGHTEQGLPFIVLTLLEGHSLGWVLKHAGALPVERVGRITVQVLSALVEAHGMGIVHRDIKPANIFLCAGDDDDVQVLDFGLAKALQGDELLTSTLTATGFRLGTPRYMSPEMARGQKANEASDLYSLGLVMAELLSGRPLVDARTQIDVLMAHGSDVAFILPDVVLQSPLCGVIQRALAKSLEVRYRTAVQMLADVEAALLRARLEALAAKGQVRWDASADLAPTLVYGGDESVEDATLPVVPPAPAASAEAAPGDGSGPSAPPGPPAGVAAPGAAAAPLSTGLRVLLGVLFVLALGAAALAGYLLAG